MKIPRGKVTTPFIEPDWPAPDNVLAYSTMRVGGFSAPPFDSFNLGHHVGDDLQAVHRNREVVARELPVDASLTWLQQVHGTQVWQASAAATQETPEADGVYSGERGVVCAVLTADCLPVLLCSRSGSVVAAAHAGWRGLHAGILEATVAAMDTQASEVIAWLGPAIGPEVFEVGDEVRCAFLAASDSVSVLDLEACFLPNPSRPGYFYADLYQLARLRLSALGIAGVYGGGLCTYSDSRRFFSYRRDGETGRMASLIMRK